MDYDDNDFQSQNLHLAGEGSTNCPPVLQPYGLPKFDFDDSLQGHLRFDSLVETEVFLGIESSEANNWIEDFSRGSSGIEFSSSAVESCSISRRNNVWSEATSSESVEMLLKSVGQEEIIPAHTIFEESDAGKEVGCIKQMEPNLKNDDNILSEIGAVTDLQSTLLPDEITGNLSVLEDVGDQPRLEDSSQTPEVELPVDGNASVLDPNSVSDQDRLNVTKGSLFADEKCNDVNTMEFDNLVDVPPDEKPHEYSSASEMQVDNMLRSVQNIITSSDELNNQDALHNMMETSEGNRGSHVVSVDIQCRNEQAVEQATCHLEKPHYSVSEAKSVEKEIVNEDSILDVQETGNMIPQGDSILHTMGGCQDGECPGVVAETNKCEDMVVFKETAVGGEQSKSNTHELLPTTYKNDTGYAMELRNSLAGNSSGLDPILKGDSDLHSVDRCSDRESPDVLDETNKYEDVKDTDTGGYQSKSNTDELSQMAYRTDSGFEYSNINAGLLSGLDPILKGDSDLHTVEVCSDKECPEVPAKTNKCEHMVLVKDTDIGGDQSKVCTHDLSPMAYKSDTGNAVDSVSSSVNPVLRTDNDLPTVDGCSERKCPDIASETTKCEVKGTDTGGDQSNMSPHDSSPMAYRSDTGYADEVRNSNSGISSSLDPRVKMTSGKSTNKDAVESGNQPDIEIFGRTSEAPMSVIEEIEVLKGGSDENREVHSNLTATVSSAEMLSEVHVTGASKSPHDGLGVSAEELNADSHASPSILGESSQTCNENEVYKEGKSGECDQELSHSEKDSTKFPSEDNNIVLEVDGSVGKGVGSSFCEDATEKDLIFPTLKHEVAGNAPVADAPLESCNLASCGTIDAVPVSSESGATSDVHNLSVVQAAPSPAVGSYSDNKEETAIKISNDANLSCTVSSPMVEVETALGPVCEAEKGASCETAGQLFCKKLDQSPPIAVSCNTESQREPGTTVADEISKRSTTDNSVQCEFSVKKVDAEAHDGATTENKSTAEDKSEKASADITEPNMNCDGNLTQLVPSPLVLMCDGTGKKALEDSGTTEVSGDKNCAEAIVPNINSDALRNFEARLPETHVKFGALESGERSTDPNQPDCGSPKVFGTIETPEAKHEKGNIKGLTNLNAPDSNIVGDGGKHSSNSSNPTGNDLSNDQKYGTSDVSSFADFPKGNDANSSQAFPALPAPKIIEGSQTNSGSGQMDAKISQEISRGGPQVSDGEIATGGSKGTTERKRRRAPSKGMGKESAKKGTVKATTPMRQAERGDKSSSVSLSKSGIFQFAQPSEIQYYGLVDSSSKTYSILTSSTSTLPDLNSSAPPSLAFQQPFTDLQQVQLRAQIFVYGALIQGTAPEEAYMVSAFGGPEGGRSIWENAWRVCIERLHSQKSTPINPETSLQSSSDVRFTGARVPDQVVKQSAFQGKAISSPVGRASTKSILPTASPMIPISSPLWSIPTPACEVPQYSVVPRGSVMEYQQAHTALHSFQTSPIRNIVGHNSSWMSQSSFRGPWVAPPQSSAPEASIHFSAFPSTESVLLTPVKETTVPQVSSIKHAPSGLAGQTGGTTSVFAGASPLIDPKKVAASSSSGVPSSQPRSRKRKKISDSKELGNITLQPLSQPESALTLTATSSVSTSVAITTPITFVPKAIPEKLVMSVSPMPSSDHLKKADLGLEQKATLSEETLSKAKEARQQAEEASAHAAAAVSHSQEIWNQLDKKKNSRLISDAEAKLASAAVAVAAAAAVAKAAAAAASVASNAALQAVLMAEEAYGNPSESMRNFGTDGVNALGLATPASVFRVEDGTNSSSTILVAAREAARRRVEAASAASKRAENMAAIVKAAELAAEAVSQAGTVVAMGDPLPLIELVKAGPEGYWKVPKVSSEMVKKSNDRMREQLNLYTLREDSDTSARRLEERQSEKKETQITEHMKLPTVGEKVTETIKSALPTAENDFEETAQASKYSSILEGSQVEVFKDGGGFGVGWFTATVLSLLDGSAYVCYTELQSNEGSEKLQEWVSLDSKEDKPPKIRVARLLTPSLEGTRKRRREAMADYTWSVGDKVDAWIQNSWWEGVVTEKNKKDETILKVHFPAQGETSHVKAWHLRPSLIWKDGEWVEWSSVRNDCSSMEVGMPQEKRIKLGSPTVEGKGKDKTLKSSVVDSGKPEEPRLLSLSANEKVFNIGKNTRTENKPVAARTNRTGLQKEGSVKFGIPKPKRKFMEVSKHYVASQSNKVNEANDSMKFAKYLMPQASGFRALKNTSKIDTKDKEVAESKLKGLKSEKQRSMLDKTVPQDNLLTDLVSAPDGSSKMDHTRKIRDSARHAEGLSGKRNILETGSSYSSDGRVQGPVTFSSRTPSDFPLSKKVSSSTAKSERGNKGNFAPASGKLGKIEEDKGTSSNPANSTSEVVEPRRSNRRIQPTSRLLEGLQSSLSVSKIPSISHDKGARSQNRNASRGNNHD